MYSVNLTGSFNGVFPNTIVVHSRSLTAAVRHYKSALQARQISSGSRVVLQSVFGFKFRVQSTSSSAGSSSRSSSTTSTSTVRLGLPSNIDREAIARALGSNSSRPRRSRDGIVVTDPFGVKWVLA